jgi:hypothetical protein
MRSLACRVRWADLSRLVRFALMDASALLVSAYAFMAFSGWGFMSPVANEMVGATAVGGYALLALLITRLRPKALAYCAAVVLFLPVTVALVWLPMLASPPQFPIKTEPIAGTLYVRKVRWDAGAMGSSGTNLFIYDRPRSVPFVQHMLREVVFDDAKCQSSEAFVVLQADGRHVLARCPYGDKVGFHDFLVPLF